MEQKDSHEELNVPLQVEEEYDPNKEKFLDYTKLTLDADVHWTSPTPSSSLTNMFWRPMEGLSNEIVTCQKLFSQGTFLQGMIRLIFCAILLFF